jgi:DNA polymerase III epsilon subunit family exonuclease
MSASNRKAATLALFAAVIPAITVAVVVTDLDPTQRQALLDAARSVLWVLVLGLAVLVAGVFWIMRGGLEAHDQAARRLAASARTAATANPGHRAPLDSPSAGLRDASDAVNALADRAERAEREVAARVSEARAELKAERDRLAAVLADLEHPVIVCTRDGLVLLHNDAARAACGADGFVGVGRSVFGVLDRDDLADPVVRALRGERVTAQVRCGDRVLSLRVGPVTDGGRSTGFVLVGPATPQPRDHSQAHEESAAAHLQAAPRLGPRPVVYDFRLLHLDATGQGADDDLRALAFTVLDLETTGLHPEAGDKVVSVGAVRVDRGRVREDDVLDRLVDPGRPIPATATAVHGITDEMVHGRSRLPAVLDDLARFSADTVLVGHDIAFDLAFLRPAAFSVGIALPERVLDTLLLSAVLHPADGESHGLDVVAARFGVPVLGRHTALGDALVTAEVLVRMISQLAAAGIRTYGEAVAAASATRLARESARRF